MNNNNNNIEFFCLNEISSVEIFLKDQFNCSSNKLKKYFDKKFLNMNLKKHSCLKLPLDFVNDGLISSGYIGPQIEIIYEDNLFLVINKPENIFIHPLRYDEKNNCLSFIRDNYPELLKVNNENYDRGFIHRLDFETSGVAIYAKDTHTYKVMRESFNDLTKEKIYYAKVAGHCSLHGLYSHYLSSKETNNQKVVATQDSSRGQLGQIEVIESVYNENSNTSLLKIKLKQGLRHQIRTQLSSLGFPILGDIFYGGIPANRLYLHAANYQFIYLNKTFDFKSEPINF